LIEPRNGAVVFDFRRSVVFTNVFLTQNTSAAYAARNVKGLSLFASDSSNAWGNAVVSAIGIPSNAFNHSIAFNATGRYVRLKIDANCGDPARSSPGLLRFEGPLGTPVTAALTNHPPLPPTSIAIVPTAGMASASYPVSRLTNGVLTGLQTIIDGTRGAGATDPHNWVQLELMGEMLPLGHLCLWNYDGSARGIKTMLLTASGDSGLTWFDLGFHSLAAGGGMQSIALPGGIRANRLRLYPVTTWPPQITQQILLNELAVYAATGFGTLLCIY
jgi:hypothetical protein